MLETPLEIVERIHKLKAAEVKPAVLEGLLRDVYSKYQFDENGRVIYDEDEFRRDRLKYLVGVVQNADKAESEGKITWAERGGITEAVSQIFSEIPIKRTMGDKIRDFFEGEYVP